MKKEDIEKAAQDYDDGLIYSSVKEQCDLIKAFKAGAEYRINSVWHNANETPIPGKKALVKYITGDLIIKYRVDVFCGYEWKEMCHYDKLLQFAYIEDLMPDMEDQL